MDELNQGRKGETSMPEHQKPSYWAVLPATVRYDVELPPNAKLLWAEISSLCDTNGYCFASNKYFAQNFELDTSTIQRLIKALADRGYVRVEVERDPGTNAVLQRRIFAGINPAWSLAPPSPQNCGDPPQKCGDPSPQNCGVEQSKYINTTPLPPKGGRGGRRKRKAPRDAPDWKPERFAGLWKFYPKKGRQNKQDAMNAWDDLRPDDDLIATIGRALQKLKATEEWKRGVGIPYVATFLRGARWEDAAELGETEGDQQASAVVERRNLPVWT